MTMGVRGEHHLPLTISEYEGPGSKTQVAEPTRNHITAGSIAMKALGSHNDTKVHEWKRARTILARTFYNDLKAHGYSPNQIIELSSEILGLVTTDLREPVVVQHAHAK